MTPVIFWSCVLCRRSLRSTHGEGLRSIGKRRQSDTNMKGVNSLINGDGRQPSAAQPLVPIGAQSPATMIFLQLEHKMAHPRRVEPHPSGSAVRARPPNRIELLRSSLQRAVA